MKKKTSKKRPVRKSSKAPKTRVRKVTQTIAPAKPGDPRTTAQIDSALKKSIRKAAAPDTPTILCGDGGHAMDVNLCGDASIIAAIRETHRRRQDFLRAEVSLTNQVKAIQCRMCMERIRKHLATHGASTIEQIPLVDFDKPTITRATGALRTIKLIVVDKGLVMECQATGRLSSSNQMPDAPSTLEASAEDHAERVTQKTTVTADALSADPTDLTDEEVADMALALATVGPVHYATLPFIEARAGIKKRRMIEQKRLEKLAAQLPVVWFVHSINGFGLLGLAQIIGEAGDLSKYAGPAKLWKRMGLAVINGMSQRRATGTQAGVEQGFSPRRRSIAWNIGDSLLKKQNAYRELYLARKQYEVDTATAAGLTVVPAAKIPKGRAAQFRSLGHIDRRAARYAAKRLLRDLWRAWRDHRTDATQPIGVSPSLSALHAVSAP